MPTSAQTKARSRSTARLQDLRAKTACRVHKAQGDPEEIKQEGLQFYKALEGARKRANSTAK